jgi:hypothetical protein
MRGYTRCAGWPDSAQSDTSKSGGERQFCPKPCRLAPGAARPSNPIQSMNEWHKLGSGEGGLNDRKWVS